MNKQSKIINSIRPQESYDKYILLLEKDGVKFYLEENKDFVKVDCPACDSKNEELEFIKYGFEHKKCKNCNTLYVSLRPTEKQLFKYYDSYEAPLYWTNLLTETNNERKYIQHLPRVKKLKEIVEVNDVSKNLFVDLGAGNGNFAKAVKESNIFNKVIASDLSKDCIEYCKKQGLETHLGQISDFEDNSVDGITFNDLLEHLFSPETFLNTCFSKLKKNGILMISTPNGEGFDFKLLKDKTENITPPEHIQYLNPLSIKLLLEKIGFKVLDISTPGVLDVQIVKKQIGYKNLNLESNNEFLNYLFSLKDEKLEENFQNFLINNSLSSHMLAFATKI